MNVEVREREVRHNYVLVVYPSSENVDHLLKAIVDSGHVPLICHSFEEAQEVLKYEDIHTIVCEDHLPKSCLESLLKVAQTQTPPMPVIITSRTGEWQEFVEALQQGAFDYLPLPPRASEVSRVLQLARAEVARTHAGVPALAVPRPAQVRQPAVRVVGTSSEPLKQRYFVAATSSVVFPKTR